MTYASPPKNYPVVEPLGDTQLITEPWHSWCQRVARGLSTLQDTTAAAYSGTVTLAKLTGGGTDGSLTIVNGLVTAVTAPT